MTLEEQVCSLELAKKLKELGVNKESLFCWVEDRLRIFDISIGFLGGFQCQAYTVAELGEMLPEEYISCKTEGIKYPCLEYKKYWLCYNDIEGCNSETMQMEELEANARAKMLIHLIENKLIEV